MYRRSLVIIVLILIASFVGSPLVLAMPTYEVDIEVGCFNGTHLGYVITGWTGDDPGAHLIAGIFGSLSWAVDTIVGPGSFQISDSQAVPYGYYTLQGGVILIGQGGDTEQDSHSWSGWCGVDEYTPCDEQTEWSEWVIVQDWTWDPEMGDYFRVWERYKYDAYDPEIVCSTDRRVEWQGSDECVGDRVETIPEDERGPWELIGSHVEDGVVYEDYRRPLTRDVQTGAICAYEYKSVPVSATHSVSAGCRSDGRGEITVENYGPDVLYASIYWPEGTDNLVVPTGGTGKSISDGVLYEELTVQVEVTEGDTVETRDIAVGPCAEKVPEPCYTRIRLGLFHDADRDGLWGQDEIPLGPEPPGQAWEVYVSLEGAPDLTLDAPTGADGWTDWYTDMREDNGFVMTALPGVRVPPYRIARGEVWQVTGYATLRNDNGRFEPFPESLIPLPLSRCDQKQIAVAFALTGDPEPEPPAVRIPELGVMRISEAYANDTPVGEVLFSRDGGEIARFDLFEARLTSDGTVIPLNGALALRNGRLFGHEPDLRGLTEAGTVVTIRERGNESEWTLPTGSTSAEFGDALDLNNDLPDIITCNPEWSAVEVYELLSH